MGIVYLGRDPRLDRPVAIKVLPDGVAADPERLARFEREGRLVASLNHPNIAAIYGLEESSGRRFLVLEYVEGETLAQRIARGPLPIDETVEVCGQIAAALEAAHENGVIHRDLKPANVKLTPSGEVKVLDFGLARGGAASGSASDPSISASPTMSDVATSAGVILGTAAYMSPEQARGRSVDRRTDIWSFGCVLYECLTARQAFGGETVSDVIALILQGEPDWKALPAGTPPRLRELLHRCLTRDPKKRLRDIGEARLLLEGGDLAARAVPAAGPAVSPHASRIPWLVAAGFALATAVLAAMLAMRAPELEPVLRTSLLVPPMALTRHEPALAALSPDGTKLAVSVTDSTGTPSLWVRSLDELDGRVLAGTEDGLGPAWSPDGQSLVFATQDKLKKVDLRGGAPEVLCPLTSYGRGVSWGAGGTIAFAGGAEGPISQVPAEGGTPAPATTLAPGETGHRFPRFLPDGRHFLYASMPQHGPTYDIWIGSTDDARHRVKLLEAEGIPLYVEPGWLLFTRRGRIVAQRFDAASRKLAGKVIPLPDEPKRSDFLGGSSLLAGRRGPLAYFRPTALSTQLVWTTFPETERTPLPVPPGPYEVVVLSPDGRQAVLVRRVSESDSDLWLLDVVRGVQTRFTFGPGRVERPVWSRDGSRIAYSTNRNGHWDVYVKEVGAAGAGRAVLESGSLLKYPDAWTPDGRTLLVEQVGEKTGWDLWEVPLGGGRPRPLLTSSFDEQSAALSPDGRWLAYSTNESGRIEVYVDSWPISGHRTQVSTAGGSNPTWTPGGRGLGYLQGNDVGCRVAIDPATGRAVGASRAFRRSADLVSGSFAPDFPRVLALVTVTSGAASDEMVLVDGWRSALKSR